MEIKNKFIYYMLCIYTLVIPLLPDGIKVNAIPKLHKVLPLGDIMLGILIIVFLLYFLKNRQYFKKCLFDFTHDYMGASLILLTLVMFISISYSSYKMTALGESARFLSFVLLYFIVKYNTGRDEIKGITNIYFLTYFIINVYGIFQKITGFGLLTGYAMPGSNVLRINATFDNPNTFASFLIIGIFPVLMMIIKNKNIFIKFFFFMLLAMGLCNISFTGSRNAFLALGIGLVILAIFYNWRFLIVLLGAGGLGFIIPQIRMRLLAIGDKSLDEGRIKIWETALKMIHNHPILGVGNGNFIKLYDSYVAKYKYLAYLNYSNYPTHNSFLKVEAELGIFGGLFFICILIGAIAKIRKTLVILRDEHLRFFYIGFLAAAVSFICMNFVENLFTVPAVVAYFWMFLAGADAIYYRNKMDY